jgi:thiol-disulfide isomerase/thioredoxin
MRRYLIFPFLIFVLTLNFISCKNKEKKSEISFSEKEKNAIILDKNGNPIPLPKDKIIILNFFAYSCSACMEEMPILKKIIQEPEFKGKFQIIGLVLDSNKPDLSDPNFLIYPNNNKNFVRFKVPGTPTTYIITPEGKKLVVIFGAVTEDSFRKFLREALKKYQNLKTK